MGSATAGKGGILSASSLFAAGLFFLVVAIFFGNKAIAIGHAIVFLSLAIALVGSKGRAFARNALPVSAYFLLAFVLIAILSVFVNLSLIDDPIDHLKKLRYQILTVLALAIPTVFTVLFAEQIRRDILILAWLVPMAIAVICGLIGYATGSHPFRGDDVIHIRRVSGLYGQVMTFAYTLQFTVIALAVFALSPSWWKNLTRLPHWVGWVALAIAGLGLYFTFTRGGMLGVVTGLLSFAAYRSRRLFAGVVVCGVLAGSVAFFQEARYFNFDTSVRQNQWKAASLSFLERPLFGLGYRNFERHSGDLKERYGFEKDRVRKLGSKPELKYFSTHAHNNFLEAFASTGILGGLALLGFCYFWLRESGRSRHASLWVPLVLAFIISGLFENTFFDSEVLNCVLLIYLFSQVMMRKEKEEGDSASDYSEPALSSSAGSS